MSLFPEDIPFFQFLVGFIPQFFVFFDFLVIFITFIPVIQGFSRFSFILEFKSSLNCL